MPPHLRNYAALDSSTMSWAMLRFRPIAPKPHGQQPEDDRNLLAAVKNKTRTKRKYVRVRDRPRRPTTKGKAKTSPPTEISGVDDGSSPERAAVTLQLMPHQKLERSEDKKNIWNTTDEDDKEVMVKQRHQEIRKTSIPDDFPSVIKTWIVVECITERDAFVYDDRDIGGGGLLGFTDSEKMKNLGADTCPGFVSDGAHKVVWINEAYRKMVGADDEGIMPMVSLSLSLRMKEEILVAKGEGHVSSSFACRLRMSQQTRGGRVFNTVLPCDVWRMEFIAGFAWRLDITTALALGSLRPTI